MYKLLPEDPYPKSIYIFHGQTSTEVRDKFQDSQFVFPVAVKPDAGMMGFMFRKTDSLEKLESYHVAMTADYIIEVTGKVDVLPPKSKAPATSLSLKQKWTHWSA